MLDTQDKDEVANALESRPDASFSWEERDSLHIRVATSAFARHPVTQELCFRGMRTCDFTNVDYMVRRYAKHQLPCSRYIMV